jgi:Fe-S cluster biogenesis protein NfuA
MADSTNSNDFQAGLKRLDALLQQVEQFADPSARTHVQELMRALLDLHATGLQRMLDRIAEADPDMVRACARDEIVGGLLLLHGLHPLGPEERVRLALDRVQPALKSHGARVEFLGFDDEVVRLRLEGACHHCKSTAATMREAIENAIVASAPEFFAVDIDGLSTESSEDRESDRFALPVL